MLFLVGVVIVVFLLCKGKYLQEKFNLLPNIFMNGTDDTLNKIPPIFRSPGYWNIPWNKGTRIQRNRYYLPYYTQPFYGQGFY